MNAEEARKITNGYSANQDEVKQTLNHIYKKIKNAAEEGKNSITWVFYNCNCFENVKHACIRKLKELGYEYKEIKNPDPGNPCSLDYDVLSW